MFFWKKRKPAPTGVIWVTEEARDKGVCKAVQERIDEGGLVLPVTHFPATHRRLAELFGERGIPSRTLDDTRALSPESLQKLRHDKTAAMIPFPLLATATPFEQRQTDGDDRALLIVPEVHPTPTPSTLITEFAQSFGAGCETQFHATLSSATVGQFGAAERMKRMIEQFGVEEDTPLEHKWLWKSIKQAQEKIASRSKGNHPTDSEAQWFDVNF